MIVYFFLLLNILLLVSGQTLWKYAIEKAGGFEPGLLLLSPFVWIGLLLYGTATVIWFYVLAKLPLSVAYPSQSLAYALGILVAIYFFQEQIPATRWIGLLLIMIGVYLVALKS